VIFERLTVPPAPNARAACAISEIRAARPLTSAGVPTPSPPEGDFYHEDGQADSHVEAAAALRAAFTRLQPQGSDAWNFLAAFTHLGDRYGPYQPGASELSKFLEGPGSSRSGRSGRPKRRLRHAADGALVGPAGTPSELEEAMAQVVEAFRFLSARVRTLEERLAYQDRPVDGMPWFAPAQELGDWVEPVAAHIVSTTPGGVVLHGDCGEGRLLGVLDQAGVRARGAEPRGTVALGALESGRSVAIAEVADELAVQPPASLGGLVLSGVVDRLPLHALVSLLDHARRALNLGAPIVVVASDPAQTETQWEATARDLLDPRPLHAETWEILLQRAGFVTVAPLEGGDGGDGRFAVSAAIPR